MYICDATYRVIMNTSTVSTTTLQIVIFSAKSISHVRTGVCFVIQSTKCIIISDIPIPLYYTI